MILIFNMPALAMIGIAFAVGMVASLVVPNPGAWGAIVGATLTVADLAYRLGRKGGHWFDPTRGGSLFFLPVWLFGAALTLMGILVALVPDGPPDGAVPPAP